MDNFPSRFFIPDLYEVISSSYRISVGNVGSFLKSNVTGKTTSEATEPILGTPIGKTKIVTHNHLILYGRKNNLKNLEGPKQDFVGDKEHKKAVQKQSREEQMQQQEYKESKMK